MDQDSSNGAGPDKRNWRERLGIGAKELPKLSDEFRDEPQMTSEPAPPAGTARPAPRAPVTKPAPMAPRVAPKPTQPASEASGAATTTPSMPPSLSRATPRGADNAAQDALAEKLRAQRAAAERLAEQRVQAARSRAEGKKPDPVPQRPASPTPPLRTGSPSPRTPGLTPPPGSPRPKFSFADDRGETPQRPGLGGAPLTPPRPSLGGERGQPPFLRPAGNGSIGARPQPAFRPSSTEGGSGYVPQPRLQAPGAARPNLGAEAAGYGAARVPARRSPALDPYARPPVTDAREPSEDEFDDEGRMAPRLGRPGLSARGRSSDEFDEVFEDDQAPRSRASARDYQAAYPDGEEGFADEPRRSGGPWLLLLALLAAAVLTGAVVWFYSDSVKNLAGIGSSSSGSTPVVTAPEDPAKVAAPDASGNSQTEAPASRKKQIYDRIVGEQEVTGEMQPTEEIPVAPEAAAPADAAAPAEAAAPADGAAPVDQVPKIEPAGTADQIPVPDAPTQGATGLPEVEPPPPLPIPGSDEQGSLGLKGGSQVAAASAQPGQGATAPPPLPASSAQPSSSDANAPPPPEKATDGAAFVSGGGSGSGNGTASGQIASTEPVVTPEPDTQITPPAPVAPAETQSAAKPKPAAKKKPPAKKTATKQTNFDELGSEPVVLVPPSKQAAQGQGSSAATQPVTTAPATTPEQPATQAANPQKRKTIFDLFNAGTGSGGATTAAPTQVASAPTQTKQAATPAPQQKAAPAPAQPQASTGGGYVVQLASFRNDTDAKTEYSRLAKDYPSIVGPLKSQIRQTTVGGSTRYQLGLGPLPTRGDATRVCGELIAAGESDCIVRGP